jgi:peptide/nickel transport system substrate-binding protein
LKAIRKSTLAVIIIVLIVGIVVSTVYLTRRTVTPSFSLAPSTFVAVQGASITFNVYGLESNGVATIYFGDGHEANTTSTLTYGYQNAGRYLVGAQEFVNGQPVASTFNALQTIQVTAKVDESLAPLISVPALSFDVTKNPSAPVVRVGDQVYLYGGFLEPPTGTSITITRYDWDFGNEATKTIAANSTSFNPAENPATTTYSQPGLYPVTLTLVTENSTSMTTYKTSVKQTVAIGSSFQPYAVFSYAGIVPNPSVINVAENVGGAPFSFDPQIDYDFGVEIGANIFSTLLIYNGSSTTQFIPMAVSQVPSVANGGISPDYTTYTFQIRTGLRFSNGDPLTAYDVWYSMVRDMLFVGGNTGTPGWILAQYLIPEASIGVSIMNDASDTPHFSAIMNALTYSNSSNTVTFKLVNPTAPQLFFTAIATPYGAGILDANWLQQVGAGITFTPAGFYAYQSQGNSEGFNLKVQWSPVASGPYMIQTYVSGQSINLVPNPGFPGVPRIPSVNNTVVIQWVKDPETAFNLFTSGQADIVTYLPTNYLALIPEQVASGKSAMYQTPSLTANYFSFNLDINLAAMKTNFGPQYHIPSDYFANLAVREAFAYAFNYTRCIDEILGNKKYGIDFGSTYAGVIIPGLPYYVPPSQLQNVPTYDLAKAKQLLQQSGQYETSVDIPIVIYTGETVQFEAAQMWATALNSIDSNIVMTPVYIPLATLVAYLVAGQNPMPIYFLHWFADYPYPSDFVDPFYKQGGPLPAADGWTAEYLNSTGHADQATMFAQMNLLIKMADSSTDATLAAQHYKAAEQIAINLYMYLYAFVPNSFWVVKPYMNGYQGQISYQENPMFGGARLGLYFWWVKTCGSIQACSGRGIGP